MRIIFNEKILNNISELLKDPSVVQAADLWGQNALLEKSAIDLQIFQTNFGSISILYGPRQIGKTASLKLYLSTVRDCETLCFLDCSTYLDKRDLYQSIANQIKGDTTLILDEVQLVPEWHQALKTLYSEQLLQRCRVWCTGSEARHLIESGERLPGRKGTGKVVFAKPWSFKKFVSLFAPEKAQRLSSIDYQHVNQAWLDDQTLDLTSEWTSYLLTGGFPRCIAEYRTHETLSDATFKVYTDWIMGVWSKQRTPERSLRELASRLCRSLNSRTSYEAIGKGTDIRSPNTIRALLELQEDHFTIRTCSRYDLDSGGFMPAKQRKYYPIDSFIATVWALIGKRVLRNYAQDLPQLQLAETSFFVQTLRSENQPDVGYLYRSKSKGEVDFYFDNCAFELKSKGSPSNAQREILLDCDQAFVLKENQVPIMAFLIGENESAKLSSI